MSAHRISRHTVNSSVQILFLLLVLFVVALSSGISCVPDDPAPNPDPNPSVRLFQTMFRYPTGTMPYGVAAGDVNGDAILDLVTANREVNTVSVLMGQSDKKYALHVDYPVGTTPGMVILALVNTDAYLDVVTVNTGSDNISVLLGAADGKFGSALSAGLVTGSQPAALAVGDFNNDGFLDIATADSGTSKVSVLLGLGDGTFSYPTAFTVGSGPRWVAVDDLNKDGFADLATADRDSDTVSVLYGVGDGTFTAPISLAVGGTPRMVGIAQLDTDTWPDLVTSNPGSGDMSIIRRDAVGGYLTEERLEMQYLPTRFVLSDVSRDGRTDLAVLCFGELTDDTGAVSVQSLGLAAVMNGDGAGGFGAPRFFGVGQGAVDLTVADLNGDLRADLVTALPGLDQVSIAQGRLTNGFLTDERYAVGDRPRMAITADFNQDGQLDVAVTNLDSKDVSILLGNGNGTFQAQRVLTITDIPRALAVGNVNSDEYPDLVVTDFTQSQVSLFLGGKNAIFQPERRITIRAAGVSYSSEPRSVALADLNGDGKTDIVTGNANTDSAAVLLGDGKGLFSAPVEYKVGNFPLDVCVTDINSDAKPDLVFVSTNDPDNPNDGAQPRVVRWLGKGDGTLDETTDQRYATGSGPRSLAVGSLDSDDKPDAVTAHAGNNSVYVLGGRGEGKFAQAFRIRVGTAPNTVRIADVNKDGNPDIVTINDSDTVSVLLGRGGQEFLMFMDFYSGTSSIGGDLADVNQDGKLDLLLPNRSTGDLSVLLAQP